MQIGGLLKIWVKHGDRSPDYDDWELNGDLIVWNPVLENALELSSMGIRVTPESLKSQLEKSNTLDRLNMEYHKILSTENYHLQLVAVSDNQDYVCSSYKKHTLEKYKFPFGQKKL